MSVELADEDDSNSAMGEYVRELRAAVEELQSHPLVVSVRLYPEDGQATKLNDMGVQLQLKAAFVKGKLVSNKSVSAESRQRPNIHCSAEKTTQLDAVRAMKQKLLLDYGEETVNARSVLASPAPSEAFAAAAASVRATGARTAFSEMLASSLAIKARERAVKEAEEFERKAQALDVEAEAKAAEARLNLAAASRQTAAAREALEVLKKNSGAKRQKAAQDTPQTVHGSSLDFSHRPYLSYNLSKYMELESKAWARRRVELSEKPARKAEDRPRGDRDGPLDHWRRGLVGAVQEPRLGGGFIR